MLARALEQVHAELLGAEPPAAARVEHRQRVARQVREVTSHERRIGEDVHAGRLILEALGGRGPVVVVRRARVDARGADASHRGFVRPLDEEGHLRGIGGGEEVAAAIHPEQVAALARQLLEQID